MQTAHKADGPLATYHARCAKEARMYDRDPGLKHATISAGVYLVFHGHDWERTEAEREAGWGPRAYRLFMDTLDTPEKLNAELMRGHAVLFGGKA
jgi:hypothetical protein